MINNYSLFDFIGKIGVFGDLRFEIIKNFGILSPLSPQNGLSVNKSANYEKHSPVKGIDYLEFQKRNLTQVSFKIKIVTADITGIKQRVDRMMSNGEHYPLLIGYGSLANIDSHFVITDFQETKNHTDARGNAISSEFDINFLEYKTDIERGETYSEALQQQGTAEKEEEEIDENNADVYEELEGGRLW